MADGKDAMRFGLYLPCVGSNPVPGSAKEPGNRFTLDLALTDIQYESAQPRKPDGEHMEGMRALAAQKILVEALSLELGKKAARPSLYETHISWVLVTPNYAYKFKKAIRFDFIDYSTLERRQFYCNEELRLNRGRAPGRGRGGGPGAGAAGRPAREGD